MSQTESTKTKKRLHQYFVEMFLILVSVLLAFFLNELRSNYIENKNLTTSLKFIQKEIIQNQTLIEEHIIIHNVILNNIDSLLKNELYHETYNPDIGFDYNVIYPKNFFNELLSGEAWKIAVNNNIFNKLCIEDVVVLSRAYDQQVLVINEAMEINKFLSSNIVYDENFVKTNCQILRNRFINLRGLEVRLAINYRAALEVLAKLNK